MMRIGIVGPAERAMAWESHLRPHQSVSEVIISASLKGIDSVDACLLLDDTDARFNQLLEAIKKGWHTFAINKLPADPDYAEKVYHLSEEANICVQFSHWPTLAPATQWMMQKAEKPSFIHINRDISHTKFIENNLSFTDIWVDELAFCLKYMGGAVHHIDVNTSALQAGEPHAIHLALRFDSGATAVVFISTCSKNEQHRRFVSDHSFILDCNVEEQLVRIGRETDNQHLFFDKKIFDPSTAAEDAATKFLKSIQLRKPSAYNSYDLLRLTNLLKQIKSR